MLFFPYFPPIFSYIFLIYTQDTIIPKINYRRSDLQWQTEH